MLKKIFISLLMFIFIYINNSTPLYADQSAQPVKQVDNSVSGSQAANNAAITISTNGLTSANVIITGGWSATENFEVSVDGINWSAINVSPLNGGSTVTTTTANGTWTAPIAGYNSFRVRMSPYTSGTAIVTIRGGQGATLFTCMSGCGVFGSLGSTSGNPIFSTDPNIAPVAQDGSKNQGVYIAGSGQGATSSSPLYSTDPNINKINLDSNGNTVVTGTGANSAVTTAEAFSVGVEYQGASLTTTASTLTFTNPYSKLIITAFGFSTTTTVANCNFGAVATISNNGGLAVPNGIPITVPWRVTTGSTTISCIMVTGTGTVTIAAFR